ncbi:MAG: lysophospholipid acyltransferase family protein [Pseudomonadota bacterium]
MNGIPLEEPRTRGRRMRGRALGTAAFLGLFPPLLVINVVQTLSVVLLPFSRPTFRRVNRGCANLWWSMCVVGARRFFGTRVEITGDGVPADEDTILLCNHQSMADIPILFDLAWRKGRLGDLKWYVKDVLKFVPGIGWGMLFLDCLFIKRAWTEDKARIRRIFRRIVSGRVPIWIVSFAEGTRFTPAKAARSAAYAAEKGLPVLRHTLLPRTKGFVATLEGLGDHANAILDCTIGYPDGVPTLWQWAKGYVPRVSLHVRRFPINALPRDDEGRADWLMERYVEKDRLLAEFESRGRFPGASMADRP